MDLWSITTPSPSGSGWLSTINPWPPCYNYNTDTILIFVLHMDPSLIYLDVQDIKEINRNRVKEDHWLLQIWVTSKWKWWYRELITHSPWVYKEHPAFYGTVKAGLILQLLCNCSQLHDHESHLHLTNRRHTWSHPWLKWPCDQKFYIKSWQHIQNEYILAEIRLRVINHYKKITSYLQIFMSYVSLLSR